MNSTKKLNCNICCDDFKHLVKCPFCDHECCRFCVEKFLLGIEDPQPRCMNPECKKIWSYDFIYKNTSSTFYSKKYRDRVSEIVMDRQKSMIPATQTLAKIRIKNEKINNEIDLIYKKNRELTKLIYLNKQKIRALSNKIYNNRNTATNDMKNKKENFIMACPLQNCKGFLNSSLKCGMCDVYVCGKCHSVKNGRHDNNHECKKDDIETVKLLKKNTKSCPSCNTHIFKIDGCDQMYCTNCRTPFSWRTGKIEKGVIHNPHYYEYLRSINNGNIPRVPGDNPNNRCQNQRINYRKLIRKLVDFMPEKIRVNFTRIYDHIRVVVLPEYLFNLSDNFFTELRVDFILNKIDEKKWKSKVKAGLKKEEKLNEYYQIIDMFANSIIDIYSNIINSDEYDIYITEAHELRNYVNNSFKSTGDRFKNVYPFIDSEWNFHRNYKKSINI